VSAYGLEKGVKGERNARLLIFAEHLVCKGKRAKKTKKTVSFPSHVVEERVRNQRTFTHRLSSVQLLAEQIPHHRITENNQSFRLDNVNPFVEGAVLRLAGVRRPEVAEG
jgi:hypothetical protein